MWKTDKNWEKTSVAANCPSALLAFFLILSSWALLCSIAPGVNDYDDKDKIIKMILHHDHNRNVEDKDQHT